jgi:hypothetical protein
MHAVIEFVQQEKCQKCSFSMTAWLPKIVGTAETIMKVLSVVLAHSPIL